MQAPRADAVPAGGCFERVRSDRHLRRNPDQVVRRMIVAVGWDSCQTMVFSHLGA